MQLDIRYPEVYILHSLKTINPFWLTEAKCSIINFFFHFLNRGSQRYLVSTLTKTSESVDADAMIMGILCRFITYFLSFQVALSIYIKQLFSNQQHYIVDYSSKINVRDRQIFGGMALHPDTVMNFSFFVILSAASENLEQINRDQLIHSSVFTLLKDYFSYLYLRQLRPKEVQGLAECLFVNNKRQHI